MKENEVYLMEKDMLKKILKFQSAIHEIVQIYGETELGNCEVDDDAIAEFCASDRFWSDFYEFSTKEEIYERVTNEILNGFPIWNYLKVSDWTKNMLEKSYNNQLDNDFKELCKTYKCYTCKYFKLENTCFGMHEGCSYPKKKDKMGKAKREIFHVKKSCVSYEKGR